MSSYINPSAKVARRQTVAWIILLVLTAGLTFAAARFPRFPGDVQVARLVQSLALGHTWAQWVTATAKAPLSYVLLGITLVAALFLSGWRAAFLSIPSFCGVLLFDPALKSWIARPRPSAALIHVVGSNPGSSMPSTFALVYASTFGFLALMCLMESRLSKGGRVAVLIPCLGLLVMGGIARIVLGGHWPSDILLSYLIGFLWVTLLLGLMKALSK